MASRIYTELPLEPVAAQEVSPELTQETEAKPSARWYLWESMGKRIIGILAAILVAYLLYLGYQRYMLSRQSESGAIHSDDPVVRSTPDSSSDDAPAVKPRAAVPVTPAPAPVTSTLTTPATDSIAPNPTNGTTYAGTGKFQVYRQGNLTWRVDTDSGASCILFATMEEWRKPIVYSHGCNQN